MHIIKFYVCMLTTLLTRIFSFSLCESCFISKLCIFLEWCCTIASFLFVSFNSFIFYASKYIVCEDLENIFHMRSQYVCWHLNEREKRKSHFHFNMEIFFFVYFDNEQDKHFYYLCSCISSLKYLCECFYKKKVALSGFFYLFLFHFTIITSFVIEENFVE